MTKKDYIKFANLFRSQKDYKNINEDTAILYGLLLDNTIAIFKNDNPRFDRDRFIDYINK